MEHLLLVDRELFPLVVIPFVGEKWDGESFLGYPERCQYDTTTHKFFGVAADNTQDESYAFYQTWAYLGLLGDAFLCEDPNEKFLRQDDDAGSLVLTTEHLAETIDLWKGRLDSMELPDKVKAIVHSIGCIRRIYNEMEEIFVPHSANFIWQEAGPLGQSVRFAISLLCDALGQAILSVTTEELEAQIEKYNSKWGRDGSQELPFPQYLRYRWRIGNFLDDAMDRALFCPVEKAGFADAPPSYLCYLLSLPQTNRLPGQHANCTATACVGNNIDEETYVTKHVTPDCDCEHDGPEIEDVKKCLRDGHIPSLSISIVDGEYQGMKVKPQKVEKPSIWRLNQNKAGIAKSLDYVALSHVWSDGLGNPFANTLPRCQLRRLAYYTNYTMNDGKARGLAGSFEKALSLGKSMSSKRSGTVWEQDGTFNCCIWVDTMCVPLDKEYRKLAIKNMNQVYRQARYVMILDASIAIHDFRTDAELMGRLVLSTWMKRVWTLQEAILGMEKLSICLRDRVVDHSDAVERLRVAVVSGEDPVRNSIYETVAVLGDDSFAGFAAAVTTLEYNNRSKISDIGATRSDKRLRETEYRQLLEGLWIIISRRATTKEEDRVLVACNILYKDVTKVLQGKGHTGRMVGLLSQFEEVPAGVIFRTGERVPVDGFRWAVHNFKVSAWGKIDLDNPGIVTPEGLLVRFAGIMLPSPPGQSGFPLMVESSGRKEFYVVNCAYPHAAGTMLEQDDWDKVVGTGRKLAIIRMSESSFTHTIPLRGGGVVSSKVYRAVLVSITGESKGTISCRYECAVYLLEPPSLDYEDAVATTHPTVTSDDSRPISQQWCVA
ncbi:hypothetical protein ABW19_dt0202885 [Dactylella cylindrospora]|nr:hypothetical protein ABW19_dt0202885 [Dactylella cylindrospora]